jgi:hypothetical protein
MEDVNEAVFLDPSNRPNYLVGLPYHSVVKTPFLFPIPEFPISLARGMSRLRTPSWLPAPKRYMLLICSSGQARDI